MPTGNKLSAYEVEWVDATTHAGWQCEPEKLLPMLVYTVGYIFHEDKRYLRIAATRAIDGTWGDVSVIPICLITKRKKIR